MAVQAPDMNSLQTSFRPNPDLIGVPGLAADSQPASEVSAHLEEQ
jgi:hypothetical protein